MVGKGTEDAGDLKDGKGRKAGEDVRDGEDS
jgi:hypothetical protein